MARPSLPEDKIRRIKEAPLSVSPEALAEELGCSARTVKRYRREAREERRETAREAMAAATEAELPSALEDLAELRRLAGTNYKASGCPKDGQLWMSAITTTLRFLGVPEGPDEFEQLTDAELAAIARGEA